MGAGPVALFNAPSPKKEENIIYIYLSRTSKGSVGTEVTGLSRL